VVFSAAPQTAIQGHGLVITLGILTAVNVIVLILSCRCAPFVGEVLQVKLLKNRAYQAFYKYHCYYWWSLGILLFLHILSGLGHIFTAS